MADFAGARCALHPMQVAVATCERCGNFMCTDCNQQGAARNCPTCRQLLQGGTFPLSRSTFSFDGLWNHSFALFKKQWVLLSLVQLIVFGINFAFSMVQQGSALLEGKAAIVFLVVTYVASILVQGALTLGSYKVAIVAHETGQVDMALIGSQFKRLLAYVGMIIVMGFIYLAAMIPTFLISGAVLFATKGSQSIDQMFQGSGGILTVIVFGLGATATMVALLPLTFAPIELAHDERCGPIEAIGRAWRVGSGFRGHTIITGLVSILVLIVGVLACCIGLLPAAGLVTLLFTGLYLAARKGSDVETPMAVGPRVEQV